MKWRVFILIVLFAIRLFIGWCSDRQWYHNKRIIVSGVYNKMYQKETNCIIDFEKVLVEKMGVCDYSLGRSQTLVGKEDSRLIDKMFGRLVLVEGENIEGENEDWVELSKQISENRGRDVRVMLMDGLRRKMPYAEAGLIEGIVLGYKEGIGKIQYEELKESGLVHVAVASGSNLVFVMGMAQGILTWFVKRKKGLWITMVVGLTYAILTGMEPPVLRAWLMVSMGFLGLALGRKVIGWWIFLLSIWILLMVSPRMIFNVSFQLTAMATFGVIVIQPIIEKVVMKNEIVNKIFSITGMGTTLGVMISVMPVQMVNFGTIGWKSLLSNPLVLPVIPLMTILGFVGIWWSGLVSEPLYYLAHWVLLVSHWVAGI